MHVMLFHSILGKRPVEDAIANTFRQDGHAVTVPDLFDGQRAESYDAAFALRRTIPDAQIAARVQAALATAEGPVVLAGVSFGAFLIGDLWHSLPHLRGVLLFSGIAPWPESKRPLPPVSAHIARPDPFDDEAFFADWQATAPDTALDLYRYDDAGHYFLDPALADYDATAASLCLARARAFLAAL